MPNTNIEAHFLGPRGENASFFRELLLEALERHVAWRESFGHTDAEFVTSSDRRTKAFIETQDAIRKQLLELSERLKLSQPFFSPRYIGHMNWDVLTSAAVAYFQTALYNPNNVAAMGSTATSDLEIEVGEDLCRLLGFSPSSGWAHLTAGGTTANMEAIWIARNLKYLPVAVQAALRKLKRADAVKVRVKGKWQPLSRIRPGDLVLGVSPDESVRLLARARAQFKSKDLQAFDDLLEKLTLQHRGIRDLDLGVVYVPQSKHYSWKKIVDLLGLGRDALRYVPLDADFRMDARALRAMIRDEERPILAVVAVIGSTEESMVDPLDRLISLRRESTLQGRSFFVHVDAAYGGYAASLFRDSNGSFMSIEAIKEQLADYRIIQQDLPERHDTSWPAPAVHAAYRALGDADAVTLDPHKLGYIQYPAGGIAYRNRGARDVIACFAPYVFKQPEPGEPDVLIGSYILEGSKPGAAAAAVWTAHRTLPLNITGYGRLIGEGLDGAHALHYALVHKSVRYSLTCCGRKVIVRPVTRPDLNILLYAFNFEDNTSLEVMNRLNERIAGECFGGIPATGTTMLAKTFIVSSTELSHEEYGMSPAAFMKELGICVSEWGPGRRVFVLRSTVMSPYLTTDYVDRNYVDVFLAAIADGLAGMRT